MKLQKLFLPFLAVIAFLSVAGFNLLQDTSITRPQLKELLVQLGYEVKDLETAPGKEKYEFKLTRDGLDIPVAAEISPSGSYIWLTVYLGKDTDATKALKLIKKNADIQPCFFYVTKSDKLMCGLPIDNRGVNNALMRQRTESIAGHVGATKGDWQ